MKEEKEGYEDNIYDWMDDGKPTGPGAAFWGMAVLLLIALGSLLFFAATLAF